VNGAFFQFLGRFQVTIQKYGFSHVSETDVVEMKIRFGIFYHYWITLRESQTISLVHFIIGLKPFSRTVERLTKTVWVRLPTSLRLLGRSDLFRDTNVRVSKSRKVRKTLLVHSRLELMSTGLESYQDRPLYQLSYPNLVFFKISELCRPWIYHKKYLTLYHFWFGLIRFLNKSNPWTDIMG